MRAEEGLLFCYNIVTLSVLFQRFFEEWGGRGQSRVLKAEYFELSVLLCEDMCVCIFNFDGFQICKIVCCIYRSIEKHVHMSVYCAFRHR